MSFVHPAIAMAAVGLASLPWLIHFINRRRFQREPWAAMMFLLKAHRRSRRRIRLENWLLLAVRTLVILLVGLAVARPYAAPPALGLVLESPRYDRVIIIDDSLSMRSRRADGIDAFDAAKDLALKVVNQAGPGDGLAVVTVSPPPRTWMDRPVHDPAEVSHIIQSLRCTATTGDLAAAVDRASDVLSRGNAVEGCRVVYVLTDLTKSSLIPKSADGNSVSALQTPPLAVASNIDRLLFVDVGPRNRFNLSISDLRFDGQLLGTDVPVRLALSVENHGDQAAANARVELRLDDRIFKTLTLDPLLPNEKRIEHADLFFPTAGPHRITASLITQVGDVLETDDRCFLSAHVASRLAVLMVEGSTSDDPVRQVLFYYRAALASQANNDAGGIFQIRTVAPGGLDGELLDDYGVIVLGDVARLSERAWNRLTQFVRRGGGLVVFLGDHVQPVNYERYAGLATEQGLIPVRLDAIIKADDPDKSVHFEISDANHPLLADFTGHDRGGLLLARVQSYWRTTPANALRRAADTTRTILSLTTGQPALLASNLGNGRVITWLLGPSMDASTLPAKPDFLPFMHNTTVYAAGDAVTRHNLTVGDTFVERIGAQNAGILAKMTLPNGRTTPVRPEPRDGEAGIVFAETDQPGTYRLDTDTSTSHFSVNVPGTESDLRLATEAELKQRLGHKASIVSGVDHAKAAAVATPPREFATAAMILLLAFVILDAAMAGSMGIRR